ncbi:MerR family transcriptional regulator [Algiphilus sp.]|uniref:MerR family transcriptional regulator n=1 Tax=Algiphilus sp. TaxID=1872431 RepID=UPI0025B9EE6A|nr:MerR family transcriptional regulator [Algiphilus sp.]MCK5770671.1 MerR family transcriptional regulator [Algiphilus sp.]
MRTIGRIATASGVGVETIRFYEREGLLPEPERSASGYRLYSDDAVARLRFIQRAKQLGFTLDEVRRLLTLADVAGPSAEVRALAADKLAIIDARLRDLGRMREALADLVECCDGSGSAASCPIIHALVDGDDAPGR